MFEVFIAPMGPNGGVRAPHSPSVQSNDLTDPSLKATLLSMNDKTKLFTAQF